MALKKHTMLFEISTAKMQSSHHKISYLEFSNFSGKLQIYVNTLALQTVISSFNNPPWTRNNVKNIFILI